jgi:hypothetical protein
MHGFGLRLKLLKPGAYERGVYTTAAALSAGAGARGAVTVWTN